MPHPDEGTIHSWLDGALPSEEAARIESHVARCPQCQAAVAEARGFIAGSSRILIALDNVPSRVIPAMTSAPVRASSARHFWRAAAAVLVIVTGSLVVFRSNTRERPIAMTRNGSAASGATSAQPVGENTPAPALAAPQTPPTVAAAIPTPTASQPAKIKTRPPVQTDALEPVSDPGAVVAFSDKPVSRPPVAGGTPSSSAPAPMQLTGAVAGASVESSSLKVVSSERVIGGRRTIFEVAPNRRVTLNEIETIQLNAVVATGAASTQSRVTTRDSAQSAQFAPTVKRGIASSQVSAPAPAAASPPSVVIPQDALAKSVTSSTAVSLSNTIRWTDPATRKLMVLSGPFPIEELQLLRARIERQRADSLLKD